MKIPLVPAPLWNAMTTALTQWKGDFLAQFVDLQAQLNEDARKAAMMAELPAMLASALDVEQYRQAGDYTDWPALDRATQAARAAGKAVKLQGQRNYEIDRQWNANDVPVFLNNATLKRTSACRSTLRAAVAQNATTIDVADATPFRVGQRIQIASGLLRADTEVTAVLNPINHAITAINGNTLTLDSKVTKAFSVGATVELSFGMIRMEGRGVLIGSSGLIDGNRQAYQLANWENNWSVFMGNGVRPLVLGVKFRRAQGDDLLFGGQNGWISRCDFADSNGGFIHLGLSYGTLIEDCTGTGADLSGDQKNPDSGSMHKEGAVTFSVGVYDTVTRRCTFKNARSFAGGIGGENNSRTTFEDCVGEDMAVTPIEWMDGATGADGGLYGLTVRRSRFTRCGKLAFGNNNGEWQDGKSGRDVTFEDVDFVDTYVEVYRTKNVRWRNVRVDVRGLNPQPDCGVILYNTNGFDWKGGFIRGGVKNLAFAAETADSAGANALRNTCIADVDLTHATQFAFINYSTAGRPYLNVRLENVRAYNSNNSASWQAFDGVKDGLRLEGVYASVGQGAGAYLYKGGVVTYGPDGKPSRFEGTASTKILRLWEKGCTLEGVATPDGSVTYWTGTAADNTVYDIRNAAGQSSVTPRAQIIEKAPATAPKLTSAQVQGGTFDTDTDKNNGNGEPGKMTTLADGSPGYASALQYTTSDTAVLEFYFRFTPTAQGVADSVRYIQYTPGNGWSVIGAETVVTRDDDGRLVNSAWRMSDNKLVFDVPSSSPLSVYVRLRVAKTSA